MPGTETAAYECVTPVCHSVTDRPRSLLGLFRSLPDPNCSAVRSSFFEMTQPRWSLKLHSTEMLPLFGIRNMQNPDTCALIMQATAVGNRAEEIRLPRGVTVLVIFLA